MEENKEKQEVKKEETQKVETLEDKGFDIKTILENEEFQKYLQSFSDKRVTEAIKTNEKKWKQTLEQEKKKAEMTQEEILADKEKQLNDRELQLEKIQYFKEKEYDLDLLDFVIGEDMDEVKEKTDLLITTINKVVDKQVEVRMKSGYVPPKGNDSKDKTTDSIGLKLAKEAAEIYKSAEDSQKQYFN